MENLINYSSYVAAAYIVAGVVLIGLMAFIVGKYVAVKSKIKNKK